MARIPSKHKDGRVQTRTRYPGIFTIEYRSGEVRYRAYTTVRGVGQISKVKETLAEARDWQASLRDAGEQKAEKARRQACVTVVEYMQEYIDTHQNLKPSTRLRYQGVLDKFMTPDRSRRYTLIGATLLVDLEATDIERWIDLMQEAGVGTPSIQKAHRTLRAALSKAAQYRLIPYNPASNVKTPAPEERDEFPVTPEQVRAIADAMTPRDRTLLLTLVLTGLRIGEASSLRARDVELEKAAIHVRENSPIVAGRLVPGTPKTAKSRRSFIISKAHADLLRDHMAEFGERLPDGTLDPEGFVFTTAKGTQIRHDNWRVRIFKEACRQAKVVRLGPNNKIETPTIKDLRDTAASLAAEAGYSLAEVGKLLGHTNVTMTGKYTHLYPEHTKDLSEALASMVLSPQGADTVGGQVVDLASRRRSVSEEGATLI